MYFPQVHACLQLLDEIDKKKHEVGKHRQSCDKVPNDKLEAVNYPNF